MFVVEVGDEFLVLIDDVVLLLGQEVVLFDSCLRDQFEGKKKYEDVIWFGYLFGVVYFD